MDKNVTILCFNLNEFNTLQDMSSNRSLLGLAVDIHLYTKPKVWHCDNRKLKWHMTDVLGFSNTRTMYQYMMEYYGIISISA